MLSSKIMNNAITWRGVLYEPFCSPDPHDGRWEASGCLDAGFSILDAQNLPTERLDYLLPSRNIQSQVFYDLAQQSIL